MNLEKIASYMDTLNEVGIPACDCKIMQGHREIFRHSAGYSDHAGTKKVTDRDIYWLYSATKPVTCVTAMRLIEEGRLELDAPVSRYLPAFEVGKMKVAQKDGSVRPSERVMTVRHLFTMTGGLTYNFNSQCLSAARENTAADTVELASAMAGDPLAFEPGERFLYSLCHDVLGAVIAVAADMSFGEYMRRVVLDPLGMNDTGFYLSDADRARMSAQYRYDMVTYRSEPVETVNESILSDRYESGGGGLYSTVDDYAKFADTVACGGTSADGYRLLKPETVAMLQENLLDYNGLKTFRTTRRKFGYGWGLCGRVHMNPAASRALSPAGEFGWDGAAGAYTLMDPSNRLSVFYAEHIRSSSYTYEIIHTTIRDMLYGELN